MLVTAYVLAGLVGLGIIYVGLSYLFAPEKTAKGFGLATIPTGTTAFFQIKGVRDIGTGLVAGAAMLAGGPHVVGWVLLAEAFIPVGDMLIILRHKGNRAMAFGVHGLTAAVMVVATLLLVLG
ncbi:DUF4267 domain-containing protein [Amycolatopsis saalfeldensis]|uniref:DUF4267 domain-containing protein n=1 Tax=Amycolatopsis saalfeldensis TaxID=394193 RepID=A0A1H8YM93_9PSEU|nr:DUF4267 domain-containing protein [Amycolatopsis saalfeldensis]SEP53193.1 protein of unknown function [Amycolatopsis saalfeldensis]